MPEYLSPGVYVEEYDSSPRSIEGVGTSTAGFIGLTAKGPTVGAPGLVTNFADFTRQYGSYLPEYTHGELRYLPLAVEQFFVNGGTRCFISRVIPEDAKTAAASQGILHLRAANEGKWGNKITIGFITTNKRKLQLIAAASETVFMAKSAAGFREGDIVEFAGEVNRIVSISENTVTFEEPFGKSPVDAAIIPKLLVYSVEMDLTVRSGAETENYTGVTLNEASAAYLGKRLAASSLVVATLDAFEEIAVPTAAIFGAGAVKGTIAFAGGSDGTVQEVNAGTFIGTDDGPGRRTGLQAFAGSNDISLIAAPGITIPEVVASLAAFCEREKNCFAILDVPKELVKTGEIINYRNLLDSTYAAFYHPWVQVFDREAKKPGFMPPSGAVAGVFSRTDVSRGVHKAPANETVVCTGLSVNYTAGEQDILNPAGVNLIRALPGQGIRVWGARTASSNSAFKYVNVRRLFIFVEQSIKLATNWVVFEPNNTSLWARVELTVGSFLETLYRSGMLAGAGSAEAYFVEIGPTTMSQDDILNGRLICNIGIAPSRPAEFVIFRLTQFTSEAEAAAEGE
ncbi:MAG: phage tail sheath subtilisin-like domain-containing protein [Gracilibacteraceae bacterium]|jgi:phage tail sheath protein FI|nr:phage tail sheath subtilisin-like domain-containing protein [Gracilibacteraceae bacterium]